MLPPSEPLFVYSHDMRSRYGETDKMGYVYYGRYMEYFEVARTEMIRAAGIPYRQLEERGFMLPVVESHIQYKLPILYDELMSVRVIIHDIPGVRLNTYYEIRTDNGNKLHTIGQVVLCFVDATTRRPVKAPDFFLSGIEQLIHDSRG
jgi:acyl-CoA thioester hydrolase